MKKSAWIGFVGFVRTTGKSFWRIVAALGLCAQGDGFAEDTLTEISSPNIQEGGGFGVWSVGLPDLTGDGVGEFFVNAIETVQVDRDGRAYVYDGATLDLLYALVPPLPMSHAFGLRRASSAGDVTGDGIPDLMAGYMTAITSGQVHFYDGADGSFLFTINSPEPDSNIGSFGHAVWLIPDVSGDGRDDWLVYQKEWGSRVGRAFVFDAATREPIRKITNQDSDANFWIRDMAPIHDVDGDGEIDLVIADSQAHRARDIGTGRAVVRSLATGKVIFELENHPDPSVDSGFAFRVNGVGDVNGDGIPDIAARGQINDLPSAGIHLLSGADGSFIRTLESPNPVPHNRFGITAAVPIPDLNGDGAEELLVTDSGPAFVHLIDPVNGEVLETMDDPGAQALSTSHDVAVIRQADGLGIRSFVFSSEFAQAAGAPNDSGLVWVRPFTVPIGPLPLLQPMGMNGGSFMIRVSATSEQPMALEASSDLQTWEVLFNFLAGANPVDLQDPDALNHPRRFYRAVATEAALVAPEIVEQATAQTVGAGDSVTFSITVSDTATLPISYHWRKDGATIHEELLWAHTATFSLEEVQPEDAGSYSVLVTNPATTSPGVLSEPFSLTVMEP